MQSSMPIESSWTHDTRLFQGQPVFPPRPMLGDSQNIRSNGPTRFAGRTEKRACDTGANAPRRTVRVYRGRWIIGLIVLGTTAAACTALQPPVPTNLGLFDSSQNPHDISALAKKLGVKVTGMSGYTDGTSWMSIGSYMPPVTALRLYLSVSMSPNNGNPSQTPRHLDVYRQLATTLVEARHSNAILRIGWEWSTNFFSWGTQNTTPAHYVTAFDDIVTAMRSVPGQHFLFDWCAAAGSAPSNGTYTASYPGDTYVDYVGTDVYDHPGTNWARELTQVGGLSYTAAFARAHRKSMSIPEWGLDGTDDPRFIDLVHAFVANPANNVRYTSYFSYPGSIDSDITQFPKAEAEFRKDFGG